MKLITAKIKERYLKNIVIFIFEMPKELFDDCKKIPKITIFSFFQFKQKC